MKNKIKNIIEEIRPDINTESDNLLEEIDSFDIVTIIASIEEEFSLKIPAEQIIPENFQNLNTIISLVEGIKK